MRAYCMGMGLTAKYISFMRRPTGRWLVPSEIPVSYRQNLLHDMVQMLMPTVRVAMLNNS